MACPDDAGRARRVHKRHVHLGVLVTPRNAGRSKASIFLPKADSNAAFVPAQGGDASTRNVRARQVLDDDVRGAAPHATCPGYWKRRRLDVLTRELEGHNAMIGAFAKLLKEAAPEGLTPESEIENHPDYEDFTPENLARDFPEMGAALAKTAKFLRGKKLID